jgi:hypothetical protein
MIIRRKNRPETITVAQKKKKKERNTRSFFGTQTLPDLKLHKTESNFTGGVYKGKGETGKKKEAKLPKKS